MQIHPLAGDWRFRQVGTEEWLPATVPGGVHTDLMAAGRIPNPFVGDNEKRVAWVAESDWEYRYTFACGQELLSEEKVFLVCDGLDTLATVALNGQELGRTDNMFIPHEFPVGTQDVVAAESDRSDQSDWSDGHPTLRVGSNTLRVIFRSALRIGRERQRLRLRRVGDDRIVRAGRRQCGINGLWQRFAGLRRFCVWITTHAGLLYLSFEKQ